MISFFAAGLLLAQSQDTGPVFEAATIKPNTSGDRSSTSNSNRTQVLIKNRPLKRIIEDAYNVKPFQVVSPGWTEDVRFDIAAKYPEGAKGDDRRPMMQALLAERFKLVVHHETREMPGYALVVAKGGFKLTPITSEGSSTNTNGGRIVTMKAAGVSMGQLADQVARELSTVVVDKTGIAGKFNFELHWLHEDPTDATPSTPDPTPTLPDVLTETLGLRLQSQKVPLDVIIVDHVERSPIEN